jgi:hypothetical protein
MANIFRRIAYLLGRRRRDADLAEEMEFHRSLSGSSAFGNATLAREDARAIWISSSIEASRRTCATPRAACGGTKPSRWCRSARWQRRSG